eukprot:1195396-Prorocentrum_minimum.AAC.8
MAQAGMALSYGLTLSGCLYYVVFNALLIETNMVAAERLQQYSDLPAERSKGRRAAAGPRWPEAGAITFENVHARCARVQYSPLHFTSLHFSMMQSSPVQSGPVQSTSLHFSPVQSTSVQSSPV